MKFRNVGIALVCVTLLPSCAALRRPGEPVTLKDAVDASVAAMTAAEKGARGHKWGLLPAEVTLTYTISDQQTAEAKANATVPIKAVNIGGDVSVSETTQRGNTIVMKFTRKGQIPTD